MGAERKHQVRLLGVLIVACAAGVLLWKRSQVQQSLFSFSSSPEYKGRNDYEKPLAPREDRTARVGEKLRATSTKASDEEANLFHAAQDVLDDVSRWMLSPPSNASTSFSAEL